MFSYPHVFIRKMYIPSSIQSGSLRFSCRTPPTTHLLPPPSDPWPLRVREEHHTLQDKMFPKAEKVSYRALLSMDLSRFLMNMFPTPLFLREGSRWDHIMRTGLPLMTSKFMVSRARSADSREDIWIWANLQTFHYVSVTLFKRASYLKVWSPKEFLNFWKSSLGQS